MRALRITTKLVFREGAGSGSNAGRYDSATGIIQFDTLLKKIAYGVGQFLLLGVDQFNPSVNSP